MPQPPHLEGLPLWLQIALSLAFGLGTLYAAFKGYLPKPALPPQAENAQIIGAQIADMGAVRRLADVMIEHGQKTESLEDSIRDLTHWIRQCNDIIQKQNEWAARLQIEREIERRERDKRG